MQWGRGGLVEALRYKPEGRGFDSRWCHWNFSFTLCFRSHYGPGFDSAPNMNEYQQYFLGGKDGLWAGLTTLPSSCADCLEIWYPQPPGTLRACPGLKWNFFTSLPLLYTIFIWSKFPYKPNICIALSMTSLWMSQSKIPTHKAEQSVRITVHLEWNIANVHKSLSVTLHWVDCVCV